MEERRERLRGSDYPHDYCCRTFKATSSFEYSSSATTTTTTAIGLYKNPDRSFSSSSSCSGSPLWQPTFQLRWSIMRISHLFLTLPFTSCISLCFYHRYVCMIYMYNIHNDSRCSINISYAKAQPMLLLLLLYERICTLYYTPRLRFWLFSFQFYFTFTEIWL